MSRQLLLRLHRWITLIFALPLAVILVTGLILSFEPMVAGRQHGTLTAAQLDGLLVRHDPDGKARGVALRPYDGSLMLSGVRAAPMVVDLATGAERTDIGALARVFLASRQLHERLVFDLRWLVSASTIAMLVVAGLGIAMGWPRLTNSLSGWHKGMAWIGLPLVILSPLTGLALAFGITFTPAPAAVAGPAVPLREAVRMVTAQHDASSLLWLRQRGRALLARVDDAGEYKVYAVGRDGLVPTERNWPRLIHEGNWAGTWSALINVVTSFALIGLLATGLWLWARRQLRRRRSRVRPAAATA
ncbi:PepSY-associated TM helix domain-containing protein [Rhodoplanes sp. TEM]|uniref:PepSY-associated TM helix domain-containing protein n=1 Tax=Rhodoplanes tepidamans TaxID=200616 RepID=A0ABT5J309_RHOTP|nr:MULTISPECIES: PepSY-associated TM helix domain-containing protein [Rhodoplanes]MDC7784075.1 PepSY-associated TM helix domain-containing protein [Rhodoplanes tepidamans]MDC7983170.1 PepSY-associated TM helix domain-containing protein [Rhodoplanes sp. TEM]MDQ0356829.1 putative iron-regulated membrane protein [Rhodoplanes tepidamans]